MCVNLLLLVGVELGLDTLDASMASMAACSHSRSASSASLRLRSLFSTGSVPAFSKTWAKLVRTLVLRVVCKSWTSGHSTADSWLHDICSDCFPLLHAALVGAGTLVALLRSPPNEFDCHVPSGRGSFRSCVTMYSTLACPRHTCRRYLLHQWHCLVA